MLFLSETYSVLLVSSLEKLNQSMTKLLPGTEYEPVRVVKSVSEARRRLLERDFDLIVINAPLPDGFGVQLALDAAGETQSGVLLTVRQEQFEGVYFRCLSAGVITLSRPTTAPMLTQQFHTLCAIRERLRLRAQREQTVEEKMAEIRLINRAKWQLIQQGMSEEEAHRYLTRLAMDRRITKAAAAAALLKDKE
jgi:response regulator NasT